MPAFCSCNVLNQISFDVAIIALIYKMFFSKLSDKFERAPRSASLSELSEGPVTGHTFNMARIGWQEQKQWQQQQHSELTAHPMFVCACPFPCQAGAGGGGEGAEQLLRECGLNDQR